MFSLGSLRCSTFASLNGLFWKSWMLFLLTNFEWFLPANLTVHIRCISKIIANMVCMLSSWLPPLTILDTPCTPYTVRRTQIFYFLLFSEGESEWPLLGFCSYLVIVSFFQIAWWWMTQICTDEKAIKSHMFKKRYEKKQSSQKKKREKVYVIIQSLCYLRTLRIVAQSVPNDCIKRDCSSGFSSE